MKVRVVRRAQSVGRTELIEIVTPRTNAATITPIENLLAAVSGQEPFSLEIALTAGSCRFLARTASAALRDQIAEQLGAAYPQAELRRLDLAAAARRRPGRPAAGRAAGRLRPRAARRALPAPPHLA